MSDKPGRIQSLEVAARILELMSDSGGVARVTDLADELSLTKARVSRHLATMCELGLVARNSDDRSYRLGLLIFKIAEGARKQFSITKVAGSHLEDLVGSVHETVVLLVPNPEGFGIVVDTRRGDGQISATVPRGETVHLPQSTAARVMAAFAWPDLDGIAGVPRGGRERRDLDGRLELIRERFYDHLSHESDDVAVLSAPVFDRDGRLEACISIVAPNTKRFHAEADTATEHLQRCAADISFVLGSSTWIDRNDAGANR